MVQNPGHILEMDKISPDGFQICAFRELSPQQIVVRMST
jgi:hypothetical protein